MSKVGINSMILSHYFRGENIAELRSFSNLLMQTSEKSIVKSATLPFCAENLCFFLYPVGAAQIRIGLCMDSFPWVCKYGVQVLLQPAAVREQISYPFSFDEGPTS